MARVLAIVGPTASGKSSLAIDVAESLRAHGSPAEIVNADATLIYRGMDIGTAKPTRAERERVRHHLVDTVDITAPASVADFQKQARAAIAECQSRGVLPIVVGGSALYIRAILDQFDFPGTDPAVRARWEEELGRVGPEALHGVLRQRAPDAARAILPGNGRRIVRALEVIELTGSFSAELPPWQYELSGVVQAGLAVPRAILDERIAQRVARMWKEGLVDEVRRLDADGLRDGRTASAALGYRQVLRYLAGECTERDAYDDTIAGTRRFARKQVGWFRRDPRISWIDFDAPDRLEQVLALLHTQTPDPAPGVRAE